MPQKCAFRIEFSFLFLVEWVASQEPTESRHTKMGYSCDSIMCSGRRATIRHRVRNGSFARPPLNIKVFMFSGRRAEYVQASTRNIYSYFTLLNRKNNATQDFRTLERKKEFTMTVCDLLNNNINMTKWSNLLVLFIMSLTSVLIWIFPFEESKYLLHKWRYLIFNIETIFGRCDAIFYTSIQSLIVPFTSFY